jgi:hypothetical protein
MAVMLFVIVVVSSTCMMGIVTVGIVVVSVVTVVVVGGSNGHLEVVPGQISENTVLDVASQETLLGEGVPVFLGIDSPSHVSSEEKRAVVSNSDVLIEIVFEQLLGLSRCHYYLTFINYKSYLTSITGFWGFGEIGRAHV